MFFSGTSGPTRKVDLRGKSRGEETREQVLERTRLEREKRKRAKLEASSAVVIQAKWRQHCAARKATVAVRSAWSDSYGQITGIVGPQYANALLNDANCLRGLLFFYDRQSEQDQAWLSSTCRVLKGAGVANNLHNDQQGQLRHRLHRLASCCLQTLVADRHAAAAAVLSSPLSSLSMSSAPHAAMLEFLLYLVTNTTSSNATLLHLQPRGLFNSLRLLLQPVAAARANGSSSTTALPAVAASCAETLTTQATARYLGLGAAQHMQRLQQQQQGRKMQPLTDLGVYPLLCAPDVWVCCPSLNPIAGRVCRMALPELAGTAFSIPSQQQQQMGTLTTSAGGGAGAVPLPLQQLLPKDGGGSLAIAVAATALLGNLLEVGEGLLPPPPTQAAAAAGGGQPTVAQDQQQQDRAVAQLLSVLLQLLLLVPVEWLGQEGGGWHSSSSSGRRLLPDGGDDDDEAQHVDSSQQLVDVLGELYAGTLPTAAGNNTTSSSSGGGASGAVGTRGRLKAAKEQVPPLVAKGLGQLSGKKGFGLLRALVSTILPATSSSSSSSTDDQQQKQLESAVSSAGQVQQLCLLLWQLLLLKPHRQLLLLSLGVSTHFVQRLWYTFLRPVNQAGAWKAVASASTATASAEVARARGVGAGGPFLMDIDSTHSSTRSSTRGINNSSFTVDAQQLQDPGWMLPLLVFSQVFNVCLSTSDTEEFYAGEPLPLQELKGHKEDGSGGLVGFLRQSVWQVLWLESLSAPQAPAAAALRAQFAEAGGRLLCQLYDRNCSRQFCPPGLFLPSGLGVELLLSEAASARASSMGGGGGSSRWRRLRLGAGRAKLTSGHNRIWQLLELAPCLIPFQERAQLFHLEISQQKGAYYETEQHHMFELGPHRFVTIRREQLLWDAFDTLNKLGEGLKGRVRIQYVSEAGVPEAGIDGGGLFKELMEELLKQGFDPSYGLFNSTPDHHLYPSPSGYQLIPQAPQLLEFLGRMLGKALWEGMLLEMPLAGFLLKKMRGLRCDVNDMYSLDPEVARHLMQLRHFKGDLSELSLTFSLSIDDFGAMREVELKPGGKDIPVTNDTVIEYIHRVADFRLNRLMSAPCAAFLRGFFDLLQPQWITMFNESELQMLISGSDEGLDLSDMQAHVNYAGGYHEDHPVILKFWEVLATFSHEEQRDFLKFVTSCSRAPLLGFAYLEPRVCIQMSGGVLTDGATERLPTSATCMNLLKLPPYQDKKQMRQKLLYAIKAGAGFELS